jgi:hypothetical protein
MVVEESTQTHSENAVNSSVYLVVQWLQDQLQPAFKNCENYCLIIEYISKLKLGSGELLIRSARKTEFINCLQNYDKLVATGKLFFFLPQPNVVDL